MQIGNLRLDNTLDKYQEIELTLHQADASYIDKEKAIFIINHLKQVFNLENV